MLKGLAAQALGSSHGQGHMGTGGFKLQLLVPLGAMAWRVSCHDSLPGMLRAPVE